MGDFINKLETDLKCIICQEVFVTPTSLNCGHIFCALCIRKWMQKFSAKKTSPSCPLCKVKICSYVISFNTANIIDNVYKHYLSEEEKSRRKRHEEERAEQFAQSNDNEDVDEVDPGIGIYDYDDSSESSVNSDIARRFDQLVDEAISTDEDLDDLDSYSIIGDDQTLRNGPTLPENGDAIPKITIQKLPNGSWSTLNDSNSTEPRLPNGSYNITRQIEGPSTNLLQLRRLPNGGYEIGHQGIRGDKTNRNQQSTLSPDMLPKDDSTSNTSDDEDESGGENDFKARQHLLVEAMLKDINEELKADINANESMEINPATPGDLGYYSGFSVESYSKEQAENEQEIVLEDMLDMKSELTKKLRNFRLCRRYPPASSTDSSDQQGQLQSNNNVEISESTPKRPRMVYSGFQLKVLEDHYIKTKYPDQTDCEHLAQITNLKKSQVKNWFNNRRSKEKRVSAYHVEVGEEDTSINQPSTSCWKGKSSAKFPSKSSNIRGN